MITGHRRYAAPFDMLSAFLSLNSTSCMTFAELYGRRFTNGRETSQVYKIFQLRRNTVTLYANYLCGRTSPLYVAKKKQQQLST